MLDDFLVRAFLAGAGLSLAAGPLGAFIVWRRMAYFGDATSHAAVLGVALALGLSLPLYAGTLFVALLMALTVSALSSRGHAMDTVLGVLAHSALAFGLVAISFVEGVRVDLSAFLFGDILTVSKTDLGVIWGGALAIVGVVIWRWQHLLTSTLHEDLAYASGQNPQREKLILTVALALVVALSIKVVGALLIAALLLVPAATARSLSRTPEAMAILAVGIGVVSTLAGLAAALTYDTPAGPSIVAASAGFFVVSVMLPRRGR